MKRLPLLLTILGLAALTVGSSQAQIPGPGQGGFGPPPGAPGFGGPGFGRGMMRGPDFGVPGGFGILQYDANADGKVTKAELDAAARKAFNDLDGNKDGSATPEEIRAGVEIQANARHEAALKANFAEMDANKNGQLTEAEFLAAQTDQDGERGARMRGPGGPGPAMIFGRGDRDGPRMERGRRFAGGPPGVPGGPPGLQGGQPPPQGAQQGQMRAGPADADGDGKLTFAEFSAQRNEAFARADTNKDGTVTLAELQARAGVPR
jgi:Ca2+-binding EF-hand superfamily protein